MRSTTPNSPTAPVQPRFWARIKKLAPFFTVQPAIWLVAVLSTMGGALAEASVPGLMKPLLDKGFQGSGLNPWTVVAIVMALFTFRSVMAFLSEVSIARIMQDGMLGLRQKIFTHLLHADLSLFNQQSASTLSNTVVYEVQNGSAMLVNSLMATVRDFLSTLALFAWLIYLSWQLTLVVALIFPVLAWVMRILAKRLYRLTKEGQTATDSLAYVVEENVLAHRMVRLHSAQHSQSERFLTLSKRLRNLANKAVVSAASMAPVTQILSGVALSCVIAVALYQSKTQGFTVGGFTSYVTAMLMLITPIKKLSEVASPITRGLAALERGMALIEQTDTESSGQHRPQQVSGNLEFKNISLHYPNAETPALQNLNLTIHPAEVVALVGSSGSGKTSLINTIPRFVLPQSGDISLDGVALKDWDLASLRSQIALVSQDVVMFNDSLAANIALGDTVDIARVERALAAANLSDFVASLPQGLDSLVGHNASQLSGGQRQRLAIARALYKNAPILLLDEATSALDNESERLVQDALQKLMQGRTTIIVAHRLSTIEHADRIVVLEQGQVVEQGTHAKLIQAGGRYASLHKAMQKTAQI